MDEDRFEFLPDSTNAVEAYNRLSKTGKVPRPLSIALMSLYKKDMVAVLQHLAEREGMATTYEDRTPAARKKRAAKANAARKKRRCQEDEDAQGPPDRNSDFIHPPKKRKTTQKPSTKVCTHLTLSDEPPSTQSQPSEEPPSQSSERTQLHGAVSCQPCQCRTGCTAKKSCICRQLGQPCLPRCHPAIRGCCNAEDAVGPVVNLDDVEDVKSTTAWVIIGNGLNLAKAP